MNTQNKKIIPKIIALIVVLIIGTTSILIITSLNNNDGKVKIQASTIQIERKNGMPFIRLMAKTMLQF